MLRSSEELFHLLEVKGMVIYIFVHQNDIQIFYIIYTVQVSAYRASSKSLQPPTELGNNVILLSDDLVLLFMYLGFCGEDQFWENVWLKLEASLS